VIADSINECAVAGYNGFEAYCGNDSRIDSIDEVPPEKFIKFIKMRPYIRSGEDYIYLFHALNENIIIDSQNDFDEFQMLYTDRKESYYQSFYSSRQTIMLNNFDNWIALNPLYNGMVEFLQSMQNKIHIISTKASKYIIEILKSNGIELNPKQIHEAGKGSSKAEIINKLIRHNNLSIKNIIFIDDHLDTLHKVKSTGVRCLLAGWGYNTDQQCGICHELNLELVDLKQFYREFKG
jgi:3-deoxy-D-manno-octulosonate 8-phosphate phosphatase KdsC-like HAD superfamily phosphatase